MKSEETDKYYVPGIEEFHVGFEYQEHSLFDSQLKIRLREGSLNDWKMTDPLSIGKWETRVFDFGSYANTSMFAIRRGYGGIRVKYLDSEDFKELGYTHIHNSVSNTNYADKSENWSKDGYQINLPILKEMPIEIYSRKDKNFIFVGYIKNKSELKRILKQLGLND